MVTIRVGGKNYEALVDTGATFSMLPEKPPSGEENGKYVTVEGIEGKQSKLPVCRPLLTKVGNNLLERAFVYSPTCPVALLGRDSLTKLQAEIFFRGKQMVVQLPVK